MLGLEPTMAMMAALTLAFALEGAGQVVPDGELQLDDYSFAIIKESAIVFFGCSFTTLP